ncbi:DUF4833 domain-containing protein [Soonwooa sp.]|uniref:DUF4833 domain-containing protein n=1 Tax=Soonwooa sp. TaxID=1938592 RepID=UPI002603429F|nr:DUF4833 domain-containing protein [Soonwooa sp.]
MKLLLFFVCFISFKICKAQTNYPTPDKNQNHLFYIQHSDNHNTFVYDAVMDGTNISEKNPINIYRVLYDENAEIKPLTMVQKSMAYGYDFKKIDSNYFEFSLKGQKSLKLYLGFNNQQKPAVFLTVNGNKIYLEKMFIQLKSFALKPSAEYILLIGKDFETGKSVTEKVKI